MHWSYWEIKEWLTKIDFTIVGSGIVGLNCAIHLKKRFPKANVLVIEKGILPQGASTKNAGFACFGSLSELIADLKILPKTAVCNLVKRRFEGLQLLRHTLGDKSIGYKHYGGYELFLNSDAALYENCLAEIKNINNLLKPIFKNNTFSVKANTFNFSGIKENCVFNAFEGQLDTGKMMRAFLKLARKHDVKIINSVEVLQFLDIGNSVSLKTNCFELDSKKLFIATNGFASQLINIDVKPARAQVLITKPIKDLKLKGTFHLNEGYYYFRNIDNRILLGGGRNLDFKTEETAEIGENALIQNHLDHLIKTIILPNNPVEIENRWSGIMGVGGNKNPILKQLSNNVFCAVKLGGMGVAIGSLLGKELSGLMD